MRLPINSFFDLTPIDLFRSGNSSSARFDLVRTLPPRKDFEGYEVKVHPGPSGDLWVDHKSGGLSLFTEPDNREKRKWWKLPAKSTIPAGLTLTEDEKFPAEGSQTHYSVRPVCDMPLSKYIDLLLLMGANAIPTFRSF